MNIIEEIRQSRIDTLTQEQKDKILAYLKRELTKNQTAYIEGGSHFTNPRWDFRQYGIEAPYDMHAPIAEWLRSIGFHVCRHINRGGVDTGMDISI